MGRWLVLATVAAAAFALSATAQAQEETGTLRVSVVYDADGDGEYAGGDCTASVYAQLEGVLGHLPEPVKKGPTDSAGEAVFSLLPGEYSVRTECAHTDQEINGIMCCQYAEADPGYRLIRTSTEAPLLLVQDVTVRSGKETTATVSESIFEQIHRGRIILWSLVVLGVVVAGCALAGLWKLRPRYNPTSDPKNPKRYEPTAPEGDQAGFDDVFGDFLKKR